MKTTFVKNYEFESKKDLKEAKQAMKYSDSIEEFEWLLHMDNIKYKKIK